jgi:hypothetical protein
MTVVLLMVYTKVYYFSAVVASVFSKPDQSLTAMMYLPPAIVSISLKQHQHGTVGDVAGLSVLMQNPHLFVRHFAEVLR